MKTSAQRSIIAGGLTSSAGIFISKAIGILYVSPFEALATSENLAFYSYGYTFYDLILQIALAGIPVAIASMIAKKMAKDDIVTVLLIEKIAKRLLFIIGLLSFVSIFLFSPWIARYILTDNATLDSLTKTTNVLKIIAMAMFVVPILGSYRSVFQGLKQLQVYAYSQVLEQLVRVSFLLGVGFLVVVVLGFDSMMAVYIAIFAAVIAAVISLIDLMIKQKPVIKSLQSKAVGLPSLSNKQIYQEILYFSVPYILIMVLGNSFSIVNLFFFNQSMFALGFEQTTIELLFSMIMFTANKLTSIPQVLALGFSLAVIPFISEALALADRDRMRKYILDAIDTVLYFSIPLSFGLFFFATPIYYVFYSNHAQLGGEVLMISSMLGVLNAISPVLTTIMITISHRKQVILILLIGFIVKSITVSPLIFWFGYSGAITSTMLSSIVIITLNSISIAKATRVSYKGVLKRLVYLTISGLSLGLFAFLLPVLSIDLLASSRLVALLGLGVFGGLGLIGFVLSTWMFHIPQEIFGLNKEKVKAWIKR